MLRRPLEQLVIRPNSLRLEPIAGCELPGPGFDVPGCATGAETAYCRHRVRRRFDRVVAEPRCQVSGVRRPGRVSRATLTLAGGGTDNLRVEADGRRVEAAVREQACDQAWGLDERDRASAVWSVAVLFNEERQGSRGGRVRGVRADAREPIPGGASGVCAGDVAGGASIL
jgi:hypothetical protein